MKNILTIAFVLYSLFTFGQTNAWEEKHEFEALADQADGSSVAFDITNTGKDIQECISKASSQALFTIIFKGYPATNNATASAALSDMSNYNQNKDFFDNYLSSNTAGLAHVQKAKTNTSKPSSKQGKGKKAVVTSTTTVYILKTKLREDLQKLGYVQSASNISESLGITPTIMIVPSNSWMKVAGFHTEINSDLGPMDQYDYRRALNDPSMTIFKSIESYLKQPLQKSGFDIANLSEQLNQIAQENARNSMRETSVEQSDLDLLAKQAGANIWLHVSLIAESVSGGMETQYTITLNGIDPMTMKDVINGLPQTVKSSGDNATELIRTTINASIDNILPEIIDFFIKRDQKGIDVKVTFLKGDDASFDFNSSVNVRGRSTPFVRLLDGVMNKVSEKSSPSGSATSTRRNYDVVIPSKVEDIFSGKIVANNAETFAYDVIDALNDFGISSGVEVEPIGLGKVLVIFKDDF